MSLWASTIVSLVSYNQHTPSSGALYPDEGSAFSTWHHNVVTDIGSSEWLHLWTASIHNVTVRDNFVDTKTCASRDSPLHRLLLHRLSCWATNALAAQH